MRGVMIPYGTNLYSRYGRREVTTIVLEIIKVLDENYCQNDRISTKQVRLSLPEFSTAKVVLGVKTLIRLSVLSEPQKKGKDNVYRFKGCNIPLTDKKEIWVPECLIGCDDLL